MIEHKQIGITIIPTSVTDNATDVMVAAIRRTVSTDSNIVVGLL